MTTLPYYRESVKKAIYKWRETHREEFREYANKKGLEHYYANKDRVLEEAKTRYAKKIYCDPDRVWKSFRKMEGVFV
jgi:hypothetical protein